MADESLYTTQTPDSLDNAEDTYTMGTEMVFAQDGFIKSVRWRSATNAISSSPNAVIFSSAGTQLAIKAAGALVAGNVWNTITFDTPLAVTAGTYYIAAFGPINRYSALSGMHGSADVVNGNITAPQNNSGGGTHKNGRFVANAATTFPTSSGGAGYFVDVVYEVSVDALEFAGNRTISAALAGAMAKDQPLVGDRSIAATLTGAVKAEFGLATSAPVTVHITGDFFLLSGSAPVRVDNNSGWYQFMNIAREFAAEVATERSIPPLACPNDGEPLRTGPNGELYCPYDGWQPD